MVAPAPNAWYKPTEYLIAASSAIELELPTTKGIVFASAVACGSEKHEFNTINSMSASGA